MVTVINKVVLNTLAGAGMRLMGWYRRTLRMTARPVEEIPGRELVKVELFALAHGVALGGAALLLGMLISRSV